MCAWTTFSQYQTTWWRYKFHNIYFHPPRSKKLHNYWWLDGGWWRYVRSRGNERHRHPPDDSYTYQLYVFVCNYCKEFDVLFSNTQVVSIPLISLTYTLYYTMASNAIKAFRFQLNFFSAQVRVARCWLAGSGAAAAAVQWTYDWKYWVVAPERTKQPNKTYLNMFHIMRCDGWFILFSLAAAFIVNLPKPCDCNKLQDYIKTMPKRCHNNTKCQLKI